MIEKLKNLLLPRRRREQAAFLVEAAAVSHQGRIRGNNEDNLYAQGRILPLFHSGTEDVWKFSLQKDLTAAVFDGMGGEAAGELASYTAAWGMKEFMRNLKGAVSLQEVSSLCVDLNHRVVEAARQEKYSQIGTTAVMAFLGEGEYLICNLGDSPAYLFRNGRLSLLTLPHTNESSLKLQGITGRKPGLTQFLGIAEEELILEPYMVQGDLREHDRILLCSDGLTDMVPEAEIEYILGEEPEAPDCLRRLLNKALEGGGRDNITMILCQIQKRGEKAYG